MLEYQRVWAEINLDNIAHNVTEARKIVSDKTGIMAIIKADAYGHGAVWVSKAMLYNGADSLGVAICDEGIELRQNNIHVPILILGYTPAQKLKDVINHNLTQTVFRYDMAKLLSDTAESLGKKADVHIKIDTGMGRIGFSASPESLPEIKAICALPGLNVTGIYTHFADADKVNSAFVMEQHKKFEFIINELKNVGIKIKSTHISNSGGIIGYPQIELDTVRLGIILYGLKPSGEMGFGRYDFKPAMSLKTRISYLKTLQSGESVGYGRSYFTERETTVATIPVGYADGYMRALGNKGRVIVKGHYAPIIGTICMDQFMIDVTGIDGVKPDDEVTLIGEQNENRITAEEIAGFCDTINYEVVCSIGKRVPRVYIKNGEPIKTLTWTYV